MKTLATISIQLFFTIICLQATAQNTTASFFDDNVTSNVNNQVTFVKADNIFIKLGYTKTDIKVLWQTAAEKNTQSFEVQSSINGVDFETLQTVTAKASSKKNKYDVALNNNQTAPGKRIFRIKVNFLDGTIFYSQYVAYNVMLHSYPTNTDENLNDAALYF
jgi:hypothetical protein